MRHHVACISTSRKDTALPLAVAAAAQVRCRRYKQTLGCQHAVQPGGLPLGMQPVLEDVLHAEWSCRCNLMMLCCLALSCCWQQNMCHCAGLASEAVALLQEGHLWRYASTLAAHRLQGEQQAAALERWAAHIHQVGPILPEPVVDSVNCLAAHSHQVGAD